MTEQPMPIRAAILQQALEATTKARNVVYGDPSINLQCAGELKAVYARYAGDKYCEAHDEAIEMVLTKIGRVATGQPGHDDTYIDAAAYMAIAAECQTKVMIAEQNAVAADLPYSNATVDDDNLRRQAEGLVIAVDLINVDTALPPEPERHVEEHQPIKRDPIMPMLDPDSPLQQYGDGEKLFKLGSLVIFGDLRISGKAAEQPLWTIIRIENDDFGSFTAQHESNGHQYKGLARHIHKVVVF